MLRRVLPFHTVPLFRLYTQETTSGLRGSGFKSSAAMTSLNKKRAANTVHAPWTDTQRRKRQRLPHTCEWILREPTYNAWKSWDDASPPTLWIHGPPGCGKSYLTQYIIENLKATEDKSAVLSYFCDTSSSPASVLQSLLAQLLLHPSAGPHLKEKITEIVEQYSSDSTPLDISYRLWDRSAAILGDAPPITLVIDGLDELPSKYLLPQEFDFPCRLSELPTALGGYIRLLVISRTEISIRSAFKEDQEIQITASKVRDDIKGFISSEISKHANLFPLTEEIIDTILPRSEGIFQWAALAVKALAQEPTTKMVLERLADLPVSLDDMYGSIFEHQSLNLSRGDILLRNRILQLMLYAVRPPQVLEIANFLSVESNIFIPNLESKAIEVCGSLVNIDNGILKPVHHSLRDFLLSEHLALRSITGIKPNTGHLSISRTLLSYLAHPKFGCISEPLNSDNFRSSHPLAEYATLYWVYHASLAESDSNLQEQIRTFFNTDNAKEWADRLLLLFLRDSVLPIPPRPFNTARFFHLFSLKSQIANCFGPKQKAEVDEHITKYLCSAYEEFLEKERTQNGPASLSVLRRLLDLADVYSWCSAYQKVVAPTLHVLLETASQISSPEAQNLALAAYQALADEYKRNGKYEDAQKLLNQLLSLASDQIPRNDPKIMFALDSLGWICMRLGQLEVAATYLEEALEIAVEHYGSQSPMTLRSRVTLAEVLGKLGRNDEAEVLCSALKAQLQQHQTNSVPLSMDSISHLNTLALIYMQEGNYDKAEETYKIVVEERRKLFGEEHRLTLWAEMQWGIAMDKRGDEEAAITIFERLILRQERVLGVDHPDVKLVKERLRRT